MTTEPNPYQPPASNVAGIEVSRFEMAGKGRRLGTLLVDHLSAVVCVVVLQVGAALAFGDVAIQATEGIPDLLLGPVLMFCYYIFFEGIWARTPGKLIFRTFVVDAEGRKPPLGQIVKRTLCRFIPFEPLSFLLDDLGWHDSFSRTCVVRRRAS